MSDTISNRLGVVTRMSPTSQFASIELCQQMAEAALALTADVREAAEAIIALRGGSWGKTEDGKFVYYDDISRRAQAILGVLGD